MSNFNKILRKNPDAIKPLPDDKVDAQLLKTCCEELTKKIEIKSRLVVLNDDQERTIALATRNYEDMKHNLELEFRRKYILLMKLFQQRHLKILEGDAKFEPIKPDIEKAI